MTEERIAKVWVRLGPGDNDRERTIAFWIPPEIDAEDLLARGAAIDGNQAVISVCAEDAVGGAYTAPDLSDDEGRTFVGESLVRVLGDCQRALMTYLASYGYKIRFS